MFSDQRGDKNWYAQLKTIKKGSKLFTVKALTAPVGFAGSELKDIATIELTTDLFTSAFGDARLFFQHARVN